MGGEERSKREMKIKMLTFQTLFTMTIAPLIDVSCEKKPFSSLRCEKDNNNKKKMTKNNY